MQILYDHSISIFAVWETIKFDHTKIEPCQEITCYSPLETTKKDQLVHLHSPMLLLKIQNFKYPAGSCEFYPV